MKYIEGYVSGGTAAEVKRISTSDLIHFCGNWVWRAVEALVQAKDFKPEPAWIADRLNISTEAAKDALDGLVRLGFIAKTENGIQGNSRHCFKSCEDLDRADLFEIHNKIKKQIDQKMTSRSSFSNTILLTKKKYIAEFYQKFVESVEELNKKSARDSDCDEIYALDLSMARLTREKIEE